MLQKMNGSLQQEYKEDITAEDNAEELIQQRFFFHLTLWVLSRLSTRRQNAIEISKSIFCDC